MHSFRDTYLSIKPPLVRTQRNSWCTRKALYQRHCMMHSILLAATCVVHKRPWPSPDTGRRHWEHQWVLSWRGLSSQSLVPWSSGLHLHMCAFMGWRLGSRHVMATQEQTKEKDIVLSVTTCIFWKCRFPQLLKTASERVQLLVNNFVGKNKWIDVVGSSRAYSEMFRAHSEMTSSLSPILDRHTRADNK